MPLILAILTVLMVDLSEIPLPDPLRISRTNSCQPSLITKPTSMIIEHGFLSLHSSPRVVRPLMGCFADYTIASPFSLLLSPSTSFSPSSLVSPPIGPMPWQALLPLARGPRPLARSLEFTSCCFPPSLLSCLLFLPLLSLSRLLSERLLCRSLCSSSTPLPPSLRWSVGRSPRPFLCDGGWPRGLGGRRAKPLAPSLAPFFPSLYRNRRVCSLHS